MAIFLVIAGWPEAEFWLRRQASYNLAQVRKVDNRIGGERDWLQPMG